MTDKQKLVDIIHTIRTGGMDTNDLNRLIKAIRDRQARLRAANRRKFVANDRVQFTSSKSATLFKGTLLKVMRKYCLVQTDDGLTWRVALSILQTAGEVQ